VAEKDFVWCQRKLKVQMFQKTASIALSLIGAIALGIPNATAVEIGVSPPRFEVQMNGKTRSQSINITNFSDKPVEMRVYVRTWTTSEENELQEIESTEESLDRWIVFTPSRFTIPPNSTQNVRFAIRPKVQPKPGEHRAVLYLEEVLPNSENLPALTTIARMPIVIYGYAGEVKRVGVINSVNVEAQPDKVKAVFDVSSTGNAHVRMKGQYAIWRAAGYPGASATKPLNNLSKAKLPENILQIGSLELPPVLPDTRRQILLSIVKKLPPGNYVLDLNGELSGTLIDKGIPFTVPATTNTAAPATKPVTSSTR
jgi:Pili and flagellar-assembly chaperone, PapD N-terminal domain